MRAAQHLSISAWLKKSRLPVLFLALGLLLAACVQLNDPENTQDDLSQIIGRASPDHTIGQTIQFKNPSPVTLQLFLQADEGFPQDSLAVIELFAQPGDQQPLASYRYPLRVLNRGNPVAVPLQPVRNLPDQIFFLEVKTTGGSVQVLGRDEDSYAGGDAYSDGTLLAADLAFRLRYNYTLADLLNDLSAWLKNAWLILPLLTILWLPGRLILACLHLDQRYDWGERTALASGLSLAVIPVVLLWTSTIGLRWSLAGLLASTVTLWAGYLYSLYRNRPSQRRSTSKKGRSQGQVISIGLLAVFIISLAVRLIMVRDLVTPPWVDSVHHATIARMIIENGAYPSSYLPLIDTGDASYHPGYHAGLAAFSTLTGKSFTQAMLLYGQVLNALMIFSVYLFTNMLVKNRLAALLAALFTGLFSPMPAYYTSWGRYTQLAGMVILPAAFVLIAALLNSLSGSRRLLKLRTPKRPAQGSVKKTLASLSIAALISGGLLLVHYRVLIFYACLVIAWLIVTNLARARAPGARIILVIQTCMLIAATAATILVTLPWWPGLVSTIQPLTERAPLPRIAWLSDFSWSYLNRGLGMYLLALAIVGLAWAFYQRRRFAPILLGWTIILYAIANLGVISPRLNGVINNSSVTIALFMPITCLAGYLIAWVYTGWKKVVRDERRWIIQTGFGILVLATCLPAARTTLTILNPVTVLSRQADLEAIDWAEANLPQDAVIAVNPFLWGYGIYAGSDGGFWLAPLAGRQTLPPPVLSGIDYRSQDTLETRRLTAQIFEASRNPAELSRILSDAGVGYVFVGSRAGAFSAKALAESPFFQEIYGENGVRIFEILPGGRGD